MASTERDKTAALKRIQIYYVVIFLFAIAFFTIGGVGNAYLKNEEEWDMSAWYQLYVGAFIAGGMIAFTSILTCCIHKGNVEKREGIAKVKEGIGCFMVMLFGCFVSLIVCAVFLGTFVTESGVFGETKCDNSTSTNDTLCFESYTKIKGLSAASLIFLILSFFSNIYGFIDRDPKNEKLKVGSQAEDRNEALARLWIRAAFFLIYSVAFFAIGGVAVATLRNESDWDIKTWHQPFYGLFPAGLVIIILVFISFDVHKATSESRQADVDKGIKGIVILQRILFVSLIVCAVFLGSFVTHSREFEKCPNSTLDINSMPMTYEGSCIEDKQPLLGVSVACIVVVALCFIVIGHAWNDRTLTLDTKAPVKKAVPPKTPAKKVEPSRPKSAGNNNIKSPKKETQNKSKEQSVAAGTQVNVEDENMKKSNKIKLSPIKGQPRQINVESPGSESKGQPKETTTVKQDAKGTNIGTSGATGSVSVPVEEENEAKLLRRQNQLLQVQNQMLQDHLSGVLNVQTYQYDSLYPLEQNPEKDSVSYLQPPPPTLVLPSTSNTVPLEPPPAYNEAWK